MRHDSLESDDLGQLVRKVDRIGISRDTRIVDQVAAREGLGHRGQLLADLEVVEVDCRVRLRRNHRVRILVAIERSVHAARQRRLLVDLHHDVLELVEDLGIGVDGRPCDKAGEGRHDRLVVLVPDDVLGDHHVRPAHLPERLQ